ncbi:OmpA family protein [Chlamydia psittaci]|uniref:OmpA family protein n=1 Tax=Chlamydia psittaci TaxID=83554 RepID=UPI00027E4D95|nr:OmpA family protein [Chlamydia psittaci]AFS28543.1 ompA family protein [Chlamydia psittaci NJ1]KPZ36368.1 membrane protein [Chlamydia psittaci NJ1]MDS0919556.1 OmpA family protein [Chlamydia psittaci]MDS0989587.1 OmpA family protein [Chlamydia psittaci]MDS0995562.1 OmpA family protein [Chlamydia psittaci]
MKKKYLSVLSCLLLTLFALPSCSYPCGDWDTICEDCQHTRRRKQNFAFVPLYTDEEMNQHFADAYDSKEEQLYKTSSQSMAFRNITFATDSYTIKGEENLAILSSLVRQMQKSPKMTLYIEGHTDERGAASYNLALGARRANAVKQHLIKQGISADRLFTVSYGKEQPINLGHNELAWQQNRRTEFKIHAR